jgi:hypothetical protein
MPGVRSGFAAAALLLAGVAMPADAATLMWTLNDISFTDGGTATGWFEYDADSDIFGDFSITVSGGNPDVFPEFTYSPATTPGGFQVYNTGLLFFNFSTDGDSFAADFVDRPRQIRFGVTTAPTSAGGTLIIDTNNAFGAECYNCDPFRLLAGGTLTSGPGGGGDPGVIPEPATWAMMIAGFGLVGGVMRRRRVALDV